MLAAEGNLGSQFMIDRRYPYYRHVEEALSDHELTCVREVCRRCSLSAAFDHRRNGVLFYRGMDLGNTILYVDRPELVSADRITNRCWRQINQTWIDIDRHMAEGARIDAELKDKATREVVNDRKTELADNVRYRMNKVKHGKHSRQSSLVNGTKAKESK